MASTSKCPIFLILFTLSVIHTHQHDQQPLDPLTPEEFTNVQTIVHNLYPNIKQRINLSICSPGRTTQTHYSFKAKRPAGTKTPSRQAFIITRINHTTHEIIVDLSVDKIISDKVYDGYGYPLLTSEEQRAAGALPIKYPPFLESVRKKGLKIEEFVCGSSTIGWYGEKRRSNRVVRVMSGYLDGSVNFYMRPVEGITVTVDLDDMKIVGFKDRTTVLVPKASGTNYRGSKQIPPFGAELKGITMVQPDGPSFTIDGHRIS